MTPAAEPFEEECRKCGGTGFVGVGMSSPHSARCLECYKPDNYESEGGRVEDPVDAIVRVLGTIPACEKCNLLKCECPDPAPLAEAARDEVTRALVLSILANPLGRDWSLQGFGMLRLYLAPEVRLHVWDARFAVPGVSVMHDHPWHFDSLIVLGEVRQRRYAESESGVPYDRQTIACGVGGGPCGEVETVTMKAFPEEVYGPGQTYRQMAKEVHISSPIDGTVTVVTRRFLEDADHAHVFWPSGTKWVSAEPRPATPEEVKAICDHALAKNRRARDGGR